MYQKIAIGFLLSLFTTIAGSYLYLEFFSPQGFEQAWKLMLENKLQGMVLSLGAIPNLLLFFVFLKRREDYKARGVLIGVVIVAFLVLYYRFI
ncbi:MAG: hypothetical protein IT220_00835 [Flavobacteriaceae bacterium]|nr:hypothetical protein [Flavobacteriaceae bacterium]